VIVDLNTGAVVGCPLSVLPGLKTASLDDLRKIELPLASMLTQRIEREILWRQRPSRTHA